MVYTVQNYSEMHEFFVVCFDDYVIDAHESAERITADSLCQTVSQEYHTCTTLPLQLGLGTFADVWLFAL